MSVIKVGLGQSQGHRVTPQQILTSKLLATNHQYLANKVNQQLKDNILFEEPILTNSVDIESFNESAFEPETSKEAQAMDDLGYKMEGDGALAPEIPLDRNKYFTSMVSFLESMEEQLNTIPLSAEQKDIALILVQSIDEKGFIQNPESVYQFIHDQTASPYDSIKDVHNTLKQNIKPMGLFCKDMQESIQYQIGEIESTRTRENVRYIIDHHYTKFLKKDFEGIARSMGLSAASKNSFEKDIVSALKKIQRSPIELSTSVSSTRTSSLEPDFIVTNTPDGYHVRPAGKTLDNIYKHLERCIKGSSVHHQAAARISASIKSSKQNQSTDREREIYKSQQNALSFYDNALSEIKQVREALKHAEQMKIKFIHALLEKQEKFSHSNDLNDVLPSLQKDFILNEQGSKLTASQISSMVRNCVIEMPSGSMFQISELIQRGFMSDTGERISEGQLKSMIKDVIKLEDPEKPITDRDLTQYLNKQGVHIKKETVVELREELNIGDASFRAKEYSSHQEQMSTALSIPSAAENGIRFSSKAFEKAVQEGLAPIIYNGEAKLVRFDPQQLNHNEKLALWEVGKDGKIVNQQEPLVEITHLKELRDLMGQNQQKKASEIKKSQIVNHHQQVGVGIGGE